MRFKLSVITAVLFIATELFAQSTPPAPAAGATTTVGGTTINWYGMAMFRFRDEIISQKTKAGADSNTYDYTHQLGYKIGAKATPSKDVLVQFEIGNDWYGTDEVGGMPFNGWQAKRDPYTPFFDLAYAQWDPGYMHIAAGIIPVQGSAMMDLLGMSLFFNNGGYAYAAHIPWGVVTNFSQTGFRIGAPLVNGPISIGINAMTAMIQMRQPIIDSVNHPAVEYYLEAPITMGGLKATPQAYYTPNRWFNTKTSKGDAELGIGLDLAYTFDKTFSLRGGIGYANQSNAKSDSVNGVPFNYSGVNVNVGTSRIIGPGKLDVDLNYSTNKNNDASAVTNDKYYFIDLKYGISLAKNYVICPRLREFLSKPEATLNYQLKSRPELIFFGTF